MQDTPTLLRARRDTLAASQTIQGFFLSAAMRVIERELGKEVLSRIQAERQLPAKPTDFLRCDVVHQLNLMDAGAEALTTTGRSYSEGLVLLSQEAPAGFFCTPIGKTFISLAKASPHGCLSIAPTAYKTVASFGTRTYSRTSDRECALIYKGDLLGASYTQGLLRSGLILACQMEVEVVVLDDTSDTDFTIVARW